MSFGYLCQQCGQGRVRPIQFSFDQAVVTCDNEDCESRLDVSPWNCVVNRNLSQVYIPASNQRHIQHWSRSSSSSSGFQSDARSPGFSPARSYDSVTDREVENLLQRFLNTRPKTSERKIQSCSKTTSEKLTTNGNHYSTFFELLDGLDLESTEHTSGKECVGLPMSTLAACDDTNFDPVSSELESWMKDFESMSSPKKEQSENLDAKQIKCTEIKESIDNRLYIPSRGSAFSQVSLETDSVQSISGCCSTDNNAGVIGMHQEIRTVPPFDKTSDSTKSFIPPLNEAHFLSPATSTVSDDSGYDDAGSKLNSVLFLPSLLEKKNNPSSAIVGLGNVSFNKTQVKSSGSCSSSNENTSTPGSIPETKIHSTVESLTPCLESSQGNAVLSIDAENDKTSCIKSSQVDSVSSTEVEKDITPCVESSQVDSVISKEVEKDITTCIESSQVDSVLSKDDENDNTTQDQSADLCLQVGQNEEAPALDTPGTPSGSSQSSDPILSKHVEGLVSSEVPTVDTNKSSVNILQEPLSNVDSSSQSKKSDVVPPIKRPRGRPRKKPEEELVPVRNNKRRRITKSLKKDSCGSESLSKGLASVLRTPSFHVRKDNSRHHNLTTLSLRNCLNVKYSFNL